MTLLLLIWLLSPVISQHYGAKYLNEHQLILSENTTIRYNPFSSNLTINNLGIATITAPNKTVLSMKSLSATLSLYRLLVDTLYFSEFDIDALILNINLNNENPVIAGFSLANSTDKNKIKINNTSDNSPPTSNNGNNYQVSIPHFKLTNTVIHLAVNQSQQEIAITSLALKNVLISSKVQQAEISLEALINQAPLQLSVKVQLENNQGAIDSALTLTNFSLAPLQTFLSTENSDKNQLSMQGLINIESKQHISITPDITKINIQEFELSTENLTVEQKNKTIALNIAPLLLQSVSIELENEQAPKITGSAKLQIKNILAYEENNTQLLAKISNFNINEITISSPQSLITANIANIIIEEAVFAENTKDELPPLAQFKNLTIKSTVVSQQGLSIGEISLLGLAVDTNLDEDQNLIGLFVKPEENKPVATAEKINIISTDTSDNISKKDNFTLSIDRFFLAGSSHINFTDRSTLPHYKRYFDITKFSAGPFNNQKPQQNSQFILEGNSNKYARFELSALAQPFSQQDFYQLKGFFKEVSLPSLSTYISQALQYELKSGQLDVELDVTINNTDIDGNALLRLRGIELGAANDHESDTIKSKTSIPFNIALGMLKDNDGNVELDIPLEGNTNDPSFGMRGFISLMIKQATMSAAKEYLMATFVPYSNVVNVAISAGDYLLKVRFNDLTFPVKETQLNAKQNEFLQQFSILMKDKLDTQLTLCAIATPEDIGKILGTEITDKNEIEQLAELSKQRLDNFKDYMVNQEKIASSRLLLCSPKIDSTVGAKPRITFTD
jgi:hypothetical protein